MQRQPLFEYDVEKNIVTFFRETAPTIDQNSVTFVTNEEFNESKTNPTEETVEQEETPDNVVFNEEKNSFEILSAEKGSAYQVDPYSKEQVFLPIGTKIVYKNTIV